MNERLLNALMQLFAIAANISGQTREGRQVVESFIRQQVGLDAVDNYLAMFDEFAEKHAGFASDKAREKGKMPVRDSVKALVICEHINEELEQKQKFVVLLRLLEFANIDHISDVELDFIATMATAFNIEESEFNLIRDYIISSDNRALAEKYSAVLVADDKDAPANPEVLHIKVDHLDGDLCFLHVDIVDQYVVRYTGGEEMYLNGVSMTPGAVYIFANGSTIRSPKAGSVYYSDIVGHYLHDTDQPRIVFQAKGVKHLFKSGMGLQGIDIAEESGRLIGFMGASGSGKTTLLNAMSGIMHAQNGSVTINGKDIYEDADEVEGVIGYISQDDLLMEELTVYQNLYYNAKLCMGDLSDEKLDDLVLKTLNNLGLLEIKDVKVGSPLNKKISGGQRKRLNIGLELIREPSVLFVDEPTSGLSSRDSENIMDLLKELSLKGKLVFVVIHQPSSEIFKLFDKLFILDVGGYPVYNGNPIDGVIYFRKLANHVNADKSECTECGNVNPEQIFNIIESKIVDEYGNFTDKRKINPIQLHEFFKENIAQPVFKEVDEKVESSLRVASKFKQMMIFTVRDVLSKLSNTQYLLINFTEAPLLAFILAFLVRYFSHDEGDSTGYLYGLNENIPAYLFMAVIVGLFIGLTVAAEEIIKDRLILKREKFLNLSRMSYLLSKVLILFSISAVQMITFVLVGNWILDIQHMTADYWLVLFTTACFANMLGLNISATFDSAVTIYILIPILLIPQLLLSGVIVKFDKLNPTIASAEHVPLAGDIMTSKWAFEALAVNQFKNNRYEKRLFPYDKLLSDAEFNKTFLYSSLTSKLGYVSDNYKNKEEKVQTQVARELELIRNAIDQLTLKYTALKFEYRADLTAAKFNDEIAKASKEFLEKSKQYFINMYNLVYQKKDMLVGRLQKTAEDREHYIELKKNYYNDNLANMVKNSRDENRIIESNGQLIQKINPIYLYPREKSNPLDFRSHFYAPKKFFMGRYWDTFWFNINLVWTMTLVLFITLYFDVFRKIVEGIANLSAIIKKRLAR